MDINSQEKFIIDAWMKRYTLLPIEEWPLQKLTVLLTANAESENIEQYSVVRAVAFKETHELGDDLKVHVETRYWDGQQTVVQSHECRESGMTLETVENWTNKQFGPGFFEKLINAMKGFTDEDYIHLLNEDNKYVRTEVTLDGERHVYYLSPCGSECVIRFH